MPYENKNNFDNDRKCCNCGRNNEHREPTNDLLRENMIDKKPNF